MNPKYKLSEYDKNQIIERLREFNENHVEADNHTPLELAEYDEDKTLIAGLIGGTYWGWLYIDTLWVDEKFRKKGIGSRLLSAAEKEAVTRGCHHAHVDTMSWQAPDFYQKYGYEILSVVTDIPRGENKYHLIKSLTNK